MLKKKWDFYYQGKKEMVMLISYNVIASEAKQSHGKIASSSADSSQ